MEVFFVAEALLLIGCFMLLYVRQKGAHKPVTIRLKDVFQENEDGLSGRDILRKIQKNIGSYGNVDARLCKDIQNEKEVILVIVGQYRIGVIGDEYAEKLLQQGTHYKVKDIRFYQGRSGVADTYEAEITLVLYQNS